MLSHLDLQCLQNHLIVVFGVLRVRMVSSLLKLEFVHIAYTFRTSLPNVVPEKLLRKLSLTASGFKLVFIGQSMLRWHTNGVVY